MVADLVQLKLLLYAIGSGKVDAEHVKAAMIPWWTHVQTFMVPLSALTLNLARANELHRPEVVQQHIFLRF
jgi:hypothetical protein